MSTGMQELVRQLEMRRELPSPDDRRRLRKNAGVSLELMASVVGVSRQALATWEAGVAEPRRRNLEAYLRALRTLDGARDNKATP